MITYYQAIAFNILGDKSLEVEVITADRELPVVDHLGASLCRRFTDYDAFSSFICECVGNNFFMDDANLIKFIELEQANINALKLMDEVIRS